MDLKNNKVDQKNILEKMQKSALFFKEHFVNKTVTYTYFKGKKVSVTVYIRFVPRNFQHLVGVKYDLGGGKFWEHVLKGNVSWSKVHLTSYSSRVQNRRKGDNRTNFEKKLNSMSYIESVVRKNARICENGTLCGVDFTHLIRTNKQTVGLATGSSEDRYEFFISNLDLTNIYGANYMGFVVDKIASYNKSNELVKLYFERDIRAEQLKKRNKSKV
ncbi:PBECR4 domain-containing protein [Leuconostoc mesenteroides]|uniref:PBECR4 domain-containing protein n=1 Tax=Leuconostoc mesenteroides TaxID=1245 RepID=UPI0023628226|nr:PBECR4 domain-containing protein [Leuconostoc mesenteroides]